MSYQRGPDRSEVQLLPPCLDDYVALNALARFIDAYVEGLGFHALGFTHAQPKTTGRPAYHPAALLKLYLYGSLHRIRSRRRRLEAEATRNLELIWLWRGLRPDFQTIADFRRDNRAAFKPLFKHFNLLCRRLELFGAEPVAIDGSKFKAVNHSRRRSTREQLQVETLQAVADKGHHQAGQLEACEQAGVQTDVPEQGKHSGRGPQGQEIFPKEELRDDAAAEAYHCPAGQTLARGHQSQSRGKDGGGP